MKRNSKVFQEYGRALDRFAKKEVKVVAIGSYANTNALVCCNNAPSIPNKNFTALSRLDHQRALNLISKKTGNKVDEIENVIVWGNHG